MKVAVVKYNAGNIRSVDYALKRLGVEAVITADEAVLRAADKVIFPGVGEAETTMDFLRAGGMDRLIKELRQPVLGICLGMQLMCRHSEEGDVDCLGIFDTDVKRSFRRGTRIKYLIWDGIPLPGRIADFLKALLKKSLFISYIVSMCQSMIVRQP